MAEIQEEKMKSRKLWVGLPVIVLVFSVVFAVILTSCDPDAGEEELKGEWSKDGSDYTVEFTGSKLIITDKTGSSTKTQTCYYSVDGNKITVKQNSNDTQPLGTLTYSFPSDGKLSITGSATVQGTIAGAYTRVGGSSSGGNQTPDYIVEEPYASPAGKDFTGTITVTLATYTSGATIYYTTDGNTPTSSSTPYQNPITLSYYRNPFHHNDRCNHSLHYKRH